jgi:hypothetical protein
MAHTFSIHSFENGNDQWLHDYMEPLMASRQLSLSSADIERLRSRMPEYDEFHLVYAILMCARADLGAVVQLLPAFLNHTEASVFCTALNILREVPDEFITPDLLHGIDLALTTSSWRPLVKALHTDLCNRYRH